MAGEERARFTRMDEGTAADWAIITQQFAPFAARLADRVLAHLRLLQGDRGGFAVDRFQHSLQTATRAHRAGEGEEYVVCALLHDVGDLLTPWTHADVAAVILRPFVSEENHWMVQHHPVFQGYYFFHHVGGDRHARERYRGHPCFERTALFCERYDQTAFDPSYDTMPLAAFEPMVRRLFDNVPRPAF
jgi:predicted HD phosphohydrolase